MGIDKLINASVKIDGVMVLTGLALLAAGYAYYKRDELTRAIDITSEDNLAYQGANSVLQTVTGDEDADLGEAIYEQRAYNPVAWAFELYGRAVGDIQ